MNQPIDLNLPAAYPGTAYRHRFTVKAGASKPAVSAILLQRKNGPTAAVQPEPFVTRSPDHPQAWDVVIEIANTYGLPKLGWLEVALDGSTYGVGYLPLQ